MIMVMPIGVDFLSDKLAAILTVSRKNEKPAHATRLQLVS